MIADATIISAAVSAVVWAADGVRFTATGASVEQVTAALTDYVRARCGHVLWPRDAQRVRALIERGQSEAAIAVYFDKVGARWDAERLEVHVASERSD